MKRDRDPVWRRECFEDYVRERMTPAQFAEHIGLTVDSAYWILSGEGWKNTERPEGFVYPWPERADLSPPARFRRRQTTYVDAYERMTAEGWSYRDLAKHLGVSTSSAHDIVGRLEQKGLV